MALIKYLIAFIRPRIFYAKLPQDAFPTSNRVSVHSFQRLWCPQLVPIEFPNICYRFHIKIIPRTLSIVTKSLSFEKNKRKKCNFLLINAEKFRNSQGISEKVWTTKNQRQKFPDLLLRIFEKYYFEIRIICLFLRNSTFY